LWGQEKESQEVENMTTPSLTSRSCLRRTTLDHGESRCRLSWYSKVVLTLFGGEANMLASWLEPVLERYNFSFCIFVYYLFAFSSLFFPKIIKLTQIWE